MVFCDACKNKSSLDRCQQKCLQGSKYCKTHSKVKEPRIWADINNVHPKVILIQKIWKGFSIRSRILLAGPGCLNRSCCHNEEELVSYEPKNSVHPLDYFAFEENGKVWWFHIESIYQHYDTSKTMSNPYTREPLKLEDKRRLREAVVLRSFKNPMMKYFTTITDPLQKILLNWTHICHIIEENGFFEINPLFFTSLTLNQQYALISMIIQDFKVWASEHTNIEDSKRHQYIKVLGSLLDVYYGWDTQITFSNKVSVILRCILNDFRDNYTICFIIMSSLYRL